MNDTNTEQALKVAVEALQNIKEIQEFLGGESVLLDDVNEALAQIAKLRSDGEKR